MSVWRTKDFSIDWSNLANVNFENLGEQGYALVFDTLKYYQQTLAVLTETVKPKEKAPIIKLSDKFLQTHRNFKNV